MNSIAYSENNALIDYLNRRYIVRYLLTTRDRAENLIVASVIIISPLYGRDVALYVLHCISCLVLTAGIG